MSDLIVNPFRAAGGHRTHVITEAVVSAYIREITPPGRAPADAGDRPPQSPARRVGGYAPARARLRTERRTARRGSALEIRT